MDVVRRAPKGVTLKISCHVTADDSYTGDVLEARRPPRRLFVVSRSEPALYDFIARDWLGHVEVAVILDRRQRTRRERAIAHLPERRTGERRVRPEVGCAIAEFGWAEIRID